MNNLSLEGQFIKLVPYEEYSSKYSTYSNKKLKNIHAELVIKSIASEQTLGHIYSYEYNQIDSYLSVGINIDDNTESSIILEACNMFFNYIFTCFPIRKIYYEGNNYNLNIMKNFKKMGFKLEANLIKDYFFNGDYCDKYILALYSKDFNKGF